MTPSQLSQLKKPQKNGKTNPGKQYAIFKAGQCSRKGRAPEAETLVSEHGRTQCKACKTEPLVTVEGIKDGKQADMEWNSRGK